MIPPLHSQTDPTYNQYKHDLTNTKPQQGCKQPSPAITIPPRYRWTLVLTCKLIGLTLSSCRIPPWTIRTGAIFRYRLVIIVLHRWGRSTIIVRWGNRIFSIRIIISLFRVERLCSIILVREGSRSMRIVQRERGHCKRVMWNRRKGIIILLGVRSIKLWGWTTTCAKQPISTY